jgi:hypothetical protein
MIHIIFQIKICNYPRFKNRGLCKRKCINDTYCIYHKKTNTENKCIDNLNNFQVNPCNPDRISDKINPKIKLI